MLTGQDQLLSLTRTETLDFATLIYTVSPARKRQMLKASVSLALHEDFVSGINGTSSLPLNICPVWLSHHTRFTDACRPNTRPFCSAGLFTPTARPFFILPTLSLHSVLVCGATGMRRVAVGYKCTPGFHVLMQVDAWIMNSRMQTGTARSHARLRVLACKKYASL